LKYNKLFSGHLQNQQLYKPFLHLRMTYSLIFFSAVGEKLSELFRDRVAGLLADISRRLGITFEVKPQG
jgi:uncharacterized membrane protein